MNRIERIKISNFKKFKSLDVKPNTGLNLLIGGNESGKSSILMALDMVVSGSRRKVEDIGFENLINIDSVNEFKEKFKTSNSLEGLPEAVVEVYLNKRDTHILNGRNNDNNVQADGLRMLIRARKDYHGEILEAMSVSSDSFPYDYYEVSFKTFADQNYSGYNKYMRSIFIDSSKHHDSYSNNRFVSGRYEELVAVENKTKNRAEYRRLKDTFSQTSLRDIVGGFDESYSFRLKTSRKNNLESDLELFYVDDGVGLENKGGGKQAIIKTQLALEARKGDATDIVLIEEPENHLSHILTRQLIDGLSSNQMEGQIFVATHDSLIVSGLGLVGCVILSQDSNNFMTLHDLSEETSEFFQKSRSSNILEFILSPKAILVEGPSENILINHKLFDKVVGKPPDNLGVSVISINGLSFKRYLEVAKLVGNRVAVVTDNDGDPDSARIKSYKEYESDDIRVFCCKNKNIKTFETAVYEANKALCDTVFPGGTGSSLDYMLANKTDSSYKLAVSDGVIEPPEYIKEAILWVEEEPF